MKTNFPIRFLYFFSILEVCAIHAMPGTHLTVPQPSFLVVSKMAILTIDSSFSMVMLIRKIHSTNNPKKITTTYNQKPPTNTPNKKKPPQQQQPHKNPSVPRAGGECGKTVAIISIVPCQPCRQPCSGSSLDQHFLFSEISTKLLLPPLHHQDLSEISCSNLPLPPSRALSFRS